MKALISFLFLLPALAFGQAGYFGLPTISTAMKPIVNATNATQARVLLGILSTNQTTITNVLTAIPSGANITNAALIGVGGNGTNFDWRGQSFWTAKDWAHSVISARGNVDLACDKTNTSAGPYSASIASLNPTIEAVTGNGLIGGSDSCLIGAGSMQSVIVGGTHCTNRSDQAVLVGGSQNYIGGDAWGAQTGGPGEKTVIAGGQYNRVSDNSESFIGGGDHNSMRDGGTSMILGSYNVVTNSDLVTQSATGIGIGYNLTIDNTNGTAVTVNDGPGKAVVVLGLYDTNRMTFDKSGLTYLGPSFTLANPQSRTIKTNDARGWNMDVYTNTVDSFFTNGPHRATFYVSVWRPTWQDQAVVKVVTWSQSNTGTNFWSVQNWQLDSDNTSGLALFGVTFPLIAPLNPFEVFKVDVNGVSAMGTTFFVPKTWRIVQEPN